MMIEPLLGSKSAERVLIFLLKKNDGYASEIAHFYNTSLSVIQKQLDKLEVGGVLVSREIGRTLVYSFNPRYPFLSELKSLLEKAFTFYPEAEQMDFTLERRRPRRRGKI